MELLIDPTGDLKKLAKQCQELVTKYTDDIRLWYANPPENSNLSQYLCAEKAVKEEDTSCLSLPLLDVDREKKTEKKEEKSDKEQSTDKTKGKSEGDSGGQSEKPMEEQSEVRVEHVEL
jgi:hypothetical protein